MTATAVELWVLNFAKYQYLFTTELKNLNSAAAAAEFRFLTFAKNQYSFNTEIQISTAAAVNFWILPATNTQLIAKIKIQIRPRQRPSFEFWILLSIIIYDYLNFEFPILNR